MRKKQLSSYDIEFMAVMFEYGFSFKELRDIFDRSQGAISRYLQYYYRDNYNWRRSLHRKMVNKKINIKSDEYVTLLSIANRVAPNCFYINSGGYVMLQAKWHSDCDCRGYVSEHRLVVEQDLGRSLNDNEVVHHLNHVRHDNRLENLEVMTRCAHHKLHIKESIRNLRYVKRGNSEYRGVHYVATKSRNPWVVNFCINGVNKQLGCFETELKAAARYNEECLKYGLVDRMNDV